MDKSDSLAGNRAKRKMSGAVGSRTKCHAGTDRVAPSWPPQGSSMTPVIVRDLGQGINTDGCCRIAASSAHRALRRSR